MSNVGTVDDDATALAAQMEIAAARRPIKIQLRLISMCLLLLIRLLVLAILNGCWVRVQETLA